MLSTDIHFISVLIAAIVSLPLGFIWYGPLFGKEWIALMKVKKSDMDKNKDKMPMVYAQMLGGAFLQAFVLANFMSLALNSISFVGSPFRAGFCIAVLAWLGFVAVTKYTDVLFEGKRKKLFAIDAGYQLANMLLMAFVLAVL